MTADAGFHPTTELLAPNSRHQMTTLPALAIEHSAPALPPADLEAAAAFARQEKAPATRRAYRSDFQAFRVFCLSRGYCRFSQQWPGLNCGVAGFE
jgi:hypothetical protein